MNNIVDTKKVTISAIVPVFNEEQTVARVVETLLKSPLIDEVISVNDGSTDGSLKILEGFKSKIRIVNLGENKGKGFALAEGIKEARGEIVVFIDADLVNFSDVHLKKLLTPLLRGEARVVLGYPTKNEHSFTSQLTGERVYYKRDLVPHLTKMSQTRFGIEIFLNSLFKANKVKKVPLKGLKGLFKYEKHDSLTAVTEYLNEAIEIAQEIGRREVLLPADRKIINQLTKISSVDELKKKVGKLYSKSMKQFFEKYIVKYMKSDFLE